MKVFMMDDGFYYTRNDLMFNPGKGGVLAPKPGALKRDETGNPCLRVWQTDAHGDRYFYTEPDIYWRVEPTEWDAGVTAPIKGAIPRDKYGNPV
jgi:hypothetical protein